MPPAPGSGGIDLLALVLKVNATGARGWCRARLTAAEQFKVLNNSGMGNIGGGAAIGARQSVEEAAPLLWNTVAIVQIGVVEIFYVSSVTTRKVRGAKKVLHRALGHYYYSPLKVVGIDEI
jgi:hypothetical protein